MRCERLKVVNDVIYVMGDSIRLDERLEFEV